MRVWFLATSSARTLSVQDDLEHRLDEHVRIQRSRVFGGPVVSTPTETISGEPQARQAHSGVI